MAPPAKKVKVVNKEVAKKISVKTQVKPAATTTSSAASTSAQPPGEDKFLEDIWLHQHKTAPSTMEFNFNKKRVKVLSTTTVVSNTARGVVYWMSRDQRVQDNWAMLYAQKLAMKNKVPLYVCFCLVPKFLDATIRHYDFLLNGLQEVENDCADLNIHFHLLFGQASEVLPQFVAARRIGAVVVDFSPLRDPKRWVADVGKALPENVPFCLVDAHNIVPCWVASDKLEYGARTIRNKINSKLDTFLTHFPPVVNHPHTPDGETNPVDWEAATNFLEVDQTVKPVKWAKPGSVEGLKMLYSFCNQRIKKYGTQRNDPTVDALSNLSPWFHYGQVSVQRAILCVQQVKEKHAASVAAFCEEAIVRRELSENFCFYNEKYDSIEGTNNWAKISLDLHKKDKREYLYTRTEWEQSRTHDDLWNSAQLQLVNEGKMHGFLRMYWAKKILEWSPTPEEALATAIYLNDRYSLDGRDPNGYVGCMWSICGIHDQGWREREVFGKIRFMNYEGCKRKFNIKAFIARYGGKVHTKIQAK